MQREVRETLNRLGMSCLRVDLDLALQLLDRVKGSITITRTGANGTGAWGINVMNKKDGQWVHVGRSDADTLFDAIITLIINIKDESFLVKGP